MDKAEIKKIFDSYVEKTLEERRVLNYAQVYYDGELVAEFNRLPTKTRLNSWSLSKSVIGIAVGIAIDEGFLTLDEKICDSFKEYLPDNPSENLTGLTVRHLLTMTTGLDNPLFFADDEERYVTKDWVAYFFKQNFVYPPGERFLYCNFNTYILGVLIEIKTGRKLLDYLNEKLFTPLEIYSPDWTVCPMGHLHAANGLYLTIDEYARIGLMLYNRGVYKEHRIVSEEYLDMATVNQVKNNPPRNGYGFQFWINPDGSFRADGKFGQYIVVERKKKLMVVTMGLEGDKMLDLVLSEVCNRID
ncbi:MAG: beta-lactamase family protein [Lachnospiraceae bacterium]|nr:beta-lactamase family protein [Lachnospiraceae bacterium]